MGRRFNITLAIIALIGSLPLWFVVAQRYEGQVFPVVGEMEIVRIEPEADESTLIWVVFNKRRDCEYLGVNFYDVGGTVRERVRIDLRPDVRGADDSGRTLDIGRQTSGPWRAFISADRIKPHLYATLIHRCHPFYLTRTIWRDPRR